MWRSIWFWLALTVAVLGGVAVWAFRTTTEVEVSTAPVTDGQITRRVLATGTVQAVTTVEVGVQVSGIIASLGADDNSLVHAGQDFMGFQWDAMLLETGLIALALSTGSQR